MNTAESCSILSTLLGDGAEKYLSNDVIAELGQPEHSNTTTPDDLRDFDMAEFIMMTDEPTTAAATTIDYLERDIEISELLPTCSSLPNKEEEKVRRVKNRRRNTLDVTDLVVPKPASSKAKGRSKKGNSRRTASSSSLTPDSISTSLLNFIDLSSYAPLQKCVGIQKLVKRGILDKKAVLAQCDEKDQSLQEDVKTIAILQERIAIMKRDLAKVENQYDSLLAKVDVERRNNDDLRKNAEKELNEFHNTKEAVMMTYQKCIKDLNNVFHSDSE